ncbi:MAG TPA: NUDIX hydrolase [Candidatus Saccharimonadales bacterium]|nr:NUDIX hydrolase [Candidatus Saccharimonadales bacterium]
MNEQCYYRVSVKALPLDETGRFLLSKESNGKWELLGGGLDHGEDPIVGLKREVHEETGLVVTYVSPSPKYFITSPRLEHDSYIANVIYEVKLKDLNFTPSDECVELRYFSVDEAAKEDLFPNVREFLNRFDINLHLK